MADSVSVMVSECRVDRGDGMTLSDSREEVKPAIRKSVKIDNIGYLYPVLVKKGTMEILDGNTRKEADPSWPEKEVEVPDKETEILIRMWSNYRRVVPRRETETYLLMLAEGYVQSGTPLEQIVPKLAEKTPYGEDWIRRLLPKRLKQEKYAPSKVGLVRPSETVTEKAEPEAKPFLGVAPSPVKQKPKLTCQKCGMGMEKVLCVYCWSEIEL